MDIVPRIDASTYSFRRDSLGLFVHVCAYVLVPRGCRYGIERERGCAPAQCGKERRASRDEKSGKIIGPRIEDKDAPRNTDGDEPGLRNVARNRHDGKGQIQRRYGERKEANPSARRHTLGNGQDCAKACRRLISLIVSCAIMLPLKRRLFPSYVCLFASLLKLQTEKVEGRLLDRSRRRECSLEKGRVLRVRASRSRFFATCPRDRFRYTFLDRICSTSWVYVSVSEI